MGFEPTFVEASNQAYLVLALNANKQGQAEGYQLSVTNTGKNNIQVNADAKAGLLYAMQSLRQLAVLQSNGNVSIPCCTIKDAPAFKWRAFMEMALLMQSRLIKGMSAKYFLHIQKLVSTEQIRLGNMVLIIGANLSRATS